MSTAHKPTWKPAIGLSQNKGFVPTRSYSARDLPSYIDLKQRKAGQGTVDELRNRDFKAELLKREAELSKNFNGIQPLATIKQGSSLLNLEEDLYEKPVKKEKNIGQDLVEEQSDSLNIKNDNDDNNENPFPQDQDSSSFIRSNPSDHNLSSSSDDDQQLLRQFQRVKQQRQLQDRQKADQKAKFSRNNRESQLLKGNPLLEGGFTLTKRWYEDTVFKNQAKKTEDKKNYVNDNIRSEFHRKFISKYVMR